MFIAFCSQSVGQMVTTDNLVSGLGDMWGKFRLWAGQGFIVSAVKLHPYCFITQENTVVVCYKLHKLWFLLFFKVTSSTMSCNPARNNFKNGETDARKAQCIDCGKLLLLGSNKPGKQTVHGLKCHLKKCHTLLSTGDQKHSCDCVVWNAFVLMLVLYWWS